MKKKFDLHKFYYDWWKSVDKLILLLKISSEFNQLNIIEND